MFCLFLSPLGLHDELGGAAVHALKADGAVRYSARAHVQLHPNRLGLRSVIVEVKKHDIRFFCTFSVCMTRADKPVTAVRQYTRKSTYVCTGEENDTRQSRWEDDQKRYNQNEAQYVFAAVPHKLHCDHTHTWENNALSR